MNCCPKPVVVSPTSSPATDGPALVCLHCERAVPKVNGLELCDACNGVKGFRLLYHRTRHWTPQWEQWLRYLAERAKARLPLFD